MGHREIFLSLSNGETGLWIRYLVSGGDQAKGSFMLAVFENENVSGIRYGDEDFIVGQEGESHVGDSFVDLRNNRSFGSKIPHDIRWTNLEDRITAISGMTRLFDFRSRYILVSPYSSFDGNISFKGKVYDLNDYRGMVGYISQPDYLKEWSWMHVSGSEEDESMWMDLLVSNRKIGNGKVSLFSGRIDGKHIRSFIPAKFVGGNGFQGIRGELRASGEGFTIDSYAPGENTVKVKYDRVKRNEVFCYNTEIAHSTIYWKGRKYTPLSSFQEYGTSISVGKFPEVGTEDERKE